MEENHTKGPTLVVGKMPNGKFQLKTTMRGDSRVAVSITRVDGRFGRPKLTIKETAIHYFFICAHVWLENILAGVITNYPEHHDRQSTR